MENNRSSAAIIGICILLGLSSLGYLLASAAIEFKEYERSVRVKGLSEREYPADIVIWPIQFSAAGNDLEALYNSIEDNTVKIKEFLGRQGIKASEITLSFSPLFTITPSSLMPANCASFIKLTFNSASLNRR